MMGVHVLYNKIGADMMGDMWQVGIKQGRSEQLEKNG